MVRPAKANFTANGTSLCMPHSILQPRWGGSVIPVVILHSADAAYKHGRFRPGAHMYPR
jgi:hypothetical protein